MMNVASQIRKLIQKEASNKLKQNYWNNFINRNEYFERKIEKRMTEYLNQQMEEIFEQLDEMPITKGGPGSGIRGHRTYRPEEANRRRRRGHVDGLSLKSDKDFQKAKEKIVEQIVVDTNKTKTDAEKYFDNILRYSGLDYGKIRRGQDVEAAMNIEDFIDNSPKWNGNGLLYRGIAIKGIAHFKPGVEINMKGLSSWSSKESIAKKFAESAMRKKVIFVLPGSNSGTSIKHLSANPHEDEVLISKFTTFKVHSVEKSGEHVYVKLNEIIHPKAKIYSEVIMTKTADAKKELTIYDKWGYDSENDLIEMIDSSPIHKGGPGSGSWNAPGSPRFQWQGKEREESIEFFHGTSGELADKIFNEGLKGRKGLFGTGVYASEYFWDAMGYAVARSKGAEIAMVFLEQKLFKPAGTEGLAKDEKISKEVNILPFGIKKIEIYGPEEVKKFMEAYLSSSSLKEANDIKRPVPKKVYTNSNFLKKEYEIKNYYYAINIIAKKQIEKKAISPTIKFDVAKWDKILQRFMNEILREIVKANGEVVISSLNKYVKKGIIHKGGPGSGSWNAPGSPRFQHQGKPESILTGHERFRVSNTSKVQAKKEISEKELIAFSIGDKMPTISQSKKVFNSLTNEYGTNEDFRAAIKTAIIYCGGGFKSIQIIDKGIQGQETDDGGLLEERIKKIGYEKVKMQDIANPLASFKNPFIFGEEKSDDSIHYGKEKISDGIRHLNKILQKSSPTTIDLYRGLRMKALGKYETEHIENRIKNRKEDLLLIKDKEEIGRIKEEIKDYGKQLKEDKLIQEKMRKIENLKKGDSFNIDTFVSFSTEREIARQFSKGENIGQGGKRSYKEGEFSLIIKIKPGAKAIGISRFSTWKQSEVITKGEFVVESINKIPEVVYNKGARGISIKKNIWNIEVVISPKKIIKSIDLNESYDWVLSQFPALSIEIDNGVKDRNLLKKGIVHKVNSQDFNPLLGSEGNLQMRFDVYNPNVTQFVNDRSFRFSFDVNENTQRELKRQLSAALEEGETIPKIKERVRTIFGFEEDKTSNYRAQRIARSEVIRASNYGQEQAYIQSGVVEAKEWFTSLDERTCPACSAMDGRIIGLNQNYFNRGEVFQGFNLNYENIKGPPLHTNCFIDKQIPIFTSKGWKAIGDIKIGELVLTHKGRFRKVTNLVRTSAQKPNMVSIYLKSKKGAYSTLTLTDEHPVMINGDWVEAKKSHPGMMIRYMATECARCKKLTFFNHKYCSHTCLSLDITDKQWSSEEHRKNMSEKISKKNKEQYISGERDRFKQTEKARIISHNRIKEDNWLNYPETRKKLKSLTNLPEHRFASSERMKKNNPSLIPEVRQRMTETFKRTILNFPEKRINSIISQKGFISSLEKKMINILEDLKQEYIHQFNIKPYRVDFALPKYKIVIEVDGDYWHQDKERDTKRQKNIENEGWLVIRIKEDELENPQEVKEELARLLMNHDGEYKFFDVRITKVKRWNVKKAKTLYNLEVEEDESYIAKGFAVHNCRCTLLPVVKEEYLRNGALPIVPVFPPIIQEADEPLSPFAAGEIVNERPMSTGTLNECELVEIDNDGRGIYKNERQEKLKQKEYYTFTKGMMSLEDCSMVRREVLASEIDKILELDLVPETVLKKGLRLKTVGSTQQFIEGFKNSSHLDRNESWMNLPMQDKVNKLIDMSVFDDLIANIDRHGGNFGFGIDGQLKLIDNGAAFAHTPQKAWNGRFINCGGEYLIEKYFGKSDLEFRKLNAYVDKTKIIGEKILGSKIKINDMFKNAGLPKSEIDAFWIRTRAMAKGEFAELEEKILRDLGYI